MRTSICTYIYFVFDLNEDVAYILSKNDLSVLLLNNDLIICIYVLERYTDENVQTPGIKFFL